MRCINHVTGERNKKQLLMRSQDLILNSQSDFDMELSYEHFNRLEYCNMFQ